MSGLDLVILLALCGYAIYRQTRTTEIVGSARFKMAIIYAVVGLSLGVSLPHTPAALFLLAIGLAASAVVGVLRGYFTHVWRDRADGKIWARGSVATVVMFLGLVAFKFVLGTIAYFGHIDYDTGMGEVLVMIGLMVAMQAEIIWRRAQALGTASSSPEFHRV